MSFLSGIGAWLLKILLDWGSEMIFKWWEERSIKKELEKKDAELLQKYEEGVNAGTSLSREERRRLADNLLNRNPP